MKILVDIGHPAHVHLFRHAIRIWENHDHRVIITVRDKDITTQLLSLYGFKYYIASRVRKGTLGLLLELFEHDWKVLQIALRFKVDVLLGTSVAVSHISRLLPARSIVFNEDDVSSARAFARLSYPFADLIVTPASIPDDLGKKHVCYPSYQELAYLHPNRFQPDSAILNQLGVEKDEPYSVLRFVAFRAAHDVGQKGISLGTQRKLVRLLRNHGRVFITSEGDLPAELAKYQIRISPHRIHDVLAFADLFVGDSQSMTIEAAVLGTPAIRCNTFVGRCPVIEELEHEYRLTYGFLPSQEDRMLNKIDRLLIKGNLKQEWRQRRDVMLEEKIDLTAWMVPFVENYVKNGFKL